MVTFEEAEIMLDEILTELPDEIFHRLNGGVVIVPDERQSSHSRRPGDLYTLGEYHHQPMGLGRFVKIYYGSLMRLYSHLPPEKFRVKLKDVLHHELIHHLESLAGERDLEKKDALELDYYRRGLPMKYKLKKKE